MFMFIYKEYFYTLGNFFTANKYISTIEQNNLYFSGTDESRKYYATFQNSEC